MIKKMPIVTYVLTQSVTHVLKLYSFRVGQTLQFCADSTIAAGSALFIFVNLTAFCCCLLLEERFN